VLDEPANPQATSEVAVLAGRCFWGVQGVFQHVEGVTSAVSGYAGGGADAAHYKMVGTSTTGHAEAVRVTFDPRRVSYGRILQNYFLSPMIRPSSTAKARISGRNIGRQFSRPIQSSSR
jgi:peptide-methionine (S)-S-oxide reductase